MTEQQTDARDLEQAPAAAADGLGLVGGEGQLSSVSPAAVASVAAVPTAGEVVAVESPALVEETFEVATSALECGTGADEPAGLDDRAHPDAAGVFDDTPAAEPIEETPEEPVVEDLTRHWYILKVQVNREDSIRDALLRRVKIAGLERFFGDIVVPTEDVAEFNKNGKRRVVKKKLYPGYLLINLVINEETWFLIRETPGVGDFTGSGGKPSPMDQREVDRILRLGVSEEDGGSQVRTAIPFKAADRVRVKEGNFQNFEGEVETIDEANGSITVIINIFGRSVPVELKHWQLEAV